MDENQKTAVKKTEVADPRLRMALVALGGVLSVFLVWEGYNYVVKDKAVKAAKAQAAAEQAALNEKALQNAAMWKATADSTMKNKEGEVELLAIKKEYDRLFPEYTKAQKVVEATLKEMSDICPQIANPGCGSLARSCWKAVEDKRGQVDFLTHRVNGELITLAALKEQLDACSVALGVPSITTAPPAMPSCYGAHRLH